MAKPVEPVEPQGKPLPPVAGEPAYVFALEDLEGNSISLADFRGKKVMLNFWASWCGPCRAEIPHMVELYHELEGEDFEIVAVNLREDPETVAGFVKGQEMDFVVLLDKDAAVGKDYFVRAIPTSLFVDDEGNIHAVHTGTLTDAQLREYVQALMDS